MRVYCAYQFIEKPWGGANNFIRALHSELSTYHGVEFTDRPDAGTDVIFMCQTGKGPAQGSGLYQLHEIEKLRSAAPKAKLVMRMVNLKSHAFQLPFLRYHLSGHAATDRHTLAAAKLADHIIYQSEYQKSFFDVAGLRPKDFDVIHNGAAREFSESYSAPEFSEDRPLRLFVSCFAKRKGKRQDDISAFSELPNVKVSFAGHWPDDIPRGKVEILGLLSHEQIREKLREAHYFLFPSIRDICPNSLMEGLNMGLPAIYNAGEGPGSELVQGMGLPLQQDLEDLIQKARREYMMLRQNLQPRRSYYGIERAARDYLGVFKKVCQE